MLLNVSIFTVLLQFNHYYGRRPNTNGTEQHLNKETSICVTLTSRPDRNVPLRQLHFKAKSIKSIDERHTDSASINCTT